jgi:ribonucleoside-diphosphate reductase alpha chain
VDPDKLIPSTIGEGRDEGRTPLEGDDPIEQEVNIAASHGYVRANLQRLHKKATNNNHDYDATLMSFVDAQETRLEATSGSVVAMEAMSSSSTQTQRTQARLKGYEGDACQECGNFTLVRNGTCLKCDSCGSTSGCS